MMSTMIQSIQDCKIFRLRRNWAASEIAAVRASHAATFPPRFVRIGVRMIETTMIVAITTTMCDFLIDEILSSVLLSPPLTQRYQPSTRYPSQMIWSTPLARWLATAKKKYA